MPASSSLHPPARLCFAAAHVALHESYREVARRQHQPPTADETLAHLDWETTMGLRRWLSSSGFGIAEAMDTAQRFQLGWPAAEQLIARTGALSLPQGFCAGASCDHLADVRSPQDLVTGVAHQCRVIQGHGGIPVLLPMPWLCEQGLGEADYVAVYRGILDRIDGPVFLHWLGPMFLPCLQGYFPGGSLRTILGLDRQKVRGIKVSMLDADLEVRLRRELLPHDQIVLTGDDFHFGRLILGGDPHGAAPQQPPRIERRTRIGPHDVALGDFSHALLGVFDAIAEPAARALQALAQGDAARFCDLMAPCETLGQHVFAAPTQHYKAGLAFLSHVAGRQPNAMLVARDDLQRSEDHLRRTAELAALCSALRDDEACKARMERHFAGGRA